jgi:hypothetical protein
MKKFIYTTLCFGVILLTKGDLNASGINNLTSKSKQKIPSFIMNVDGYQVKIEHTFYNNDIAQITNIEVITAGVSNVTWNGFIENYFNTPYFAGTLSFTVFGQHHSITQAAH